MSRRESTPEGRRKQCKKKSLKGTLCNEAGRSEDGATGEGSSGRVPKGPRGMELLQLEESRELQDTAKATSDGKPCV